MAKALKGHCDCAVRTLAPPLTLPGGKGIAAEVLEGNGERFQAAAVLPNPALSPAPLRQSGQSVATAALRRLHFAWHS